MRTKTAQQVRQDFNRRGASISGWAKEHGFKPALVFNLLSGRNKGLRGQYHRIACGLGMKDGVVT